MAKDSRVVRVPYSALSYDKNVAKYRSANGRFVSYDSVRNVIESDIENTKGRMRKIGAQLQAGEIGVAQFRDRVAVEVKSLHLAEHAAGRGGFHALTQSDFGSAGAAIREQYKYLDSWCVEMAAKPEMIDGALSRLDLYCDAGLSTFESARLTSEREAGYLFEYNDDAADENVCVGKNSCAEQSALGVVPIGTLSMPGKRKCKVKDRCKIRRSKEKPAST